jgi:hypothetical protein
VDQRRILDEAAELVYGKRGEDYGPPSEDFSRAIAIYRAWTGSAMIISPVDHARYMMCVKLAREAHVHKRDNLVDLCGYAQILCDLLEGSGNA